MKPINIEQLKKQQIADAKVLGLPNPYSPEGTVLVKQAKDSGLPSPYSTMGADLLEQAKASGKTSPYDPGQLNLANGTTIKPLSTGTTAVGAMPNTPSVLSDYQMMLEVDIQKVKLQSDVAEKIKVKQSLLAQYLDFVDGYVANNESYANDVAVEMFIWMLDVEDMQRALVLGLYLISQKQVMPERFSSDMRTFLCNAMTEYAAKMLKAEQSAGPYLDTLVAIVDDQQWQIPMIARSKLYVQFAKHQERLGHFRQALEYCLKAEAINPDKAGVKGLKERVSVQLSLTQEDEQDES